MSRAQIRRAARYLDGDTFLLTYGDGVSDVNIAELLAFHQSHGKLATVTTVPPISRFGIVEMEENLVQRFIEKPKSEGWMSAGFFVLNRKAIDYLSGDDCIFERDPLERMAADGQLMA